MNRDFSSGEPLSRRSMVKLASNGVIGLGFAPVVKPAERRPDPASLKSATSGPPLPALNRFPRMVREEYVRRLRAAQKGPEARRASVRTRSDAAAYADGVRRKIAACFGPWPAKTPLNPRITGAIEWEHHRRTTAGGRFQCVGGSFGRCHSPAECFLTDRIFAFRPILGRKGPALPSKGKNSLTV